MIQDGLKASFNQSHCFKVIIALKHNQKLHLMVRLNEKLIPYQNENLSKFSEKYKNKILR